MTESNQNEDRHDMVIGEFKVSRSAVDRSAIAGPEDIFALVFKHWKSWAVVFALAFIVTTYQGRINVLEDQVGALRNIYSSLPEDKALAIGALRSVEDLRDGLTVVVEERAIELLASEGILRGGTRVSERLADLVEISAGFEKMWDGTDEPTPAIYSVVGELPDVLARSGGFGSLANVTESDSRIAFGGARYFIGHLRAESSETGLAVAVSNLRDADRVLPTSSQVRSDLIEFELALGNEALLRGDSETFIAVYRKWWPQWGELLQSDDSTSTQFRVAKGIASAMIVPLFAFSKSANEGGVAPADFEAAFDLSIQEAIRLSVTSARTALSLNVDRLPAMIARAKLDIVLGNILGSASISERLRSNIWAIYQGATKQFQGISIGLAKQALFNGAYETLTEASDIAVSHGEQIELSDLVIGQSVVAALPAEFRETLGLSAATEPTEE